VDLMPDLWRIVVGVDPAGTNHNKSDETGIVVCGVGGPRSRPEFYVLEDVSGRYSPDQWAKMAVTMYDKWDADAIAAEQQNGWDMVNATLHHQDQRVRIIKCQATRGKHLRAEPIAALYEQGRAHHLLGVGSLSKLEDQMTSWTPFDTDLSPDRLDALVWALTELSAGPGTQGSFGGATAASTSLTSGAGLYGRRPE
jgi:phage terminase large subunit-like protein